MDFSDIKCNKDSYHYSFRRLFNCECDIRVMRDLETVLINIKALHGIQHSDEPEIGVRSRGLPMHTQEILYDTIKKDLRAKPGKLSERLEEEMTRVD